MTLNNLKKGDSAVITEINASRELKNRFNSFGLVKGAEVLSKERSLAKKTIEVKVNKTSISMRASEAELVEIVQ